MKYCLIAVVAPPPSGRLGPIQNQRKSVIADDFTFIYKSMCLGYFYRNPELKRSFKHTQVSSVTWRAVQIISHVQINAASRKIWSVTGNSSAATVRTRPNAPDVRTNTNTH